MKSKVVIIFVIAVLIASLAALLVYKRLQNNPKTEVRLQEIKDESIAVAAHDLPWGTLLTRDMIKTATFLTKSLPEGSFPEPSDLVGRTVLYPINIGEPIFESRLAPSSAETGGIAAVISPKKRAMAIKVDKIIGNRGFLRPGNRVDVLVSLSQNGEVSIPITKTVLENILVLATGHIMDNGNSKKEKPIKMDAVTLEVDPEEAEKLALASTQGRIQLALRNFADTKDVVTDGSTIPALLASYRGKRNVPPEKETAPVSPVPVSFSVELIKGGQASKLYFSK